MPLSLMTLKLMAINIKTLVLVTISNMTHGLSIIHIKAFIIITLGINNTCSNDKYINDTKPNVT
jgi:hypothetical protein